MNDVLLAFIMALFAGLSTGIGSAAVLISKNPTPRFMASTLGFSAGVMLYVSLTEILSKATAALTADNGDRLGTLIVILSFFGGIALIALISALVPSFEGESTDHKLSALISAPKTKLWRTGLLSAFAIALHNFPEGMATFVSALRDPCVALPVVVAVAIHNVPEGIAVAAPVLSATGSRKTAFTVSFLSGLTEPLGALLCWLLLMPFMSDTVYGVIFAAASGIMVYISVDEILPTAEENDCHPYCIGGFILGMALMAFSLYLFI